MQRCFGRTMLAAAVATCVLPYAAFGTVYQIHVPTSTYEYLVPPEGSGIAGCQPDDFHCAFDIAGTLEFEIDLMAGNGAFVEANLQLTRNEGTAAGPDFRRIRRLP
jgi:hypothetical protein